MRRKVTEQEYIILSIIQDKLYEFITHNPTLIPDTVLLGRECIENAEDYKEICMLDIKMKINAIDGDEIILK